MPNILDSVNPCMCKNVAQTDAIQESFYSLHPFFVLHISLVSNADDGAASIAAGGIVMRQEARISMQKEVLRISPKSVSVDYEFRNDTDENVTTEVAFPVPMYEMDWAHYSPTQQGFDDFRLTVENKPFVSLSKTSP